MTTMIGWTLTSNAFPERGQKVDWISPGGDQVNGGKYHGGLVWFPPGSDMYVYYMPTHWRPAQETSP